MQEELKAVAAILTPEQREKVRDFCEDRVVVVEVAATGATPTKPSRRCGRRSPSGWRPCPTSSDCRLLSEARFAACTPVSPTNSRPSESSARPCGRQELQALGTHLTPEQREKAKEFIEDHAGAL